MQPGKTHSIEGLQIASHYQSLRTALLVDNYSQHRRRPLAHWALPTDRRLPLAFLGRNVEDLLACSFDELAATPGIGEKKIRSFLFLLERVLNTDGGELPELNGSSAPDASHVPAGPTTSPAADFDMDSVSEMVWRRWQRTVSLHGLGEETFGRLAHSLRGVTKVIWNVPLKDYLTISLAELHSRKTHGEKRVRAILEVFHSLHASLSGVQPQDHLVLRIVPRHVHQAESWVGQTMQRRGMPSEEQIRDGLILPLFEQIRIDASQQIVQLAESRLGLRSRITSVRQAARSLGLTRARVYQLLNETNDIMSVRWPYGRHQVYELRDKFDREAADDAVATNLSQFHAAIELFYPGSRRGADDHAEPNPNEATQDSGSKRPMLARAELGTEVEHGWAS